MLLSDVRRQRSNSQNAVSAGESLSLAMQCRGRPSPFVPSPPPSSNTTKNPYISIIMAGGSTFTWSHALRLDSSKSPFDSPLPQTHKAFADVKPVSWKRYNIGGILTTVYGLEELPRNADEVACLWLLHGRGDTQDSMGYTAAAMLGAWNSKRKASQKGLICVCFDQRNHGSRQIENLNNISWKQGNPTHGMCERVLCIACADVRRTGCKLMRKHDDLP